MIFLLSFLSLLVRLAKFSCEEINSIKLKICNQLSRKVPPLEADEISLDAVCDEFEGLLRAASELLTLLSPRNLVPRSKIARGFNSEIGDILCILWNLVEFTAGCRVSDSVLTFSDTSAAYYPRLPAAPEHDDRLSVRHSEVLTLIKRNQIMLYPHEYANNVLIFVSNTQRDLNR